MRGLAQILDPADTFFLIDWHSCGIDMALQLLRPPEHLARPKLDAGKSEALTLANIAIDDFSFGVASVSAEGFESPVVFPGAAGAFSARPARN
jgi:hypothetical protein